MLTQTKLKPRVVQLNFTKDAVKRQLQPILDLMDKAGGGAIAGGFVRHYINGGPSPEDIDIFTTDNVVFNHICKGLERLGLERIYETEAGKVWGAVTFVFRDNCSPHDLLPQFVQVIKPMPGVNTLDDLAETFDFTVSQAFMLPNGSTYVSRHFEADCTCLVLKVENINYPLGTLKRAFKYVQKGFSIAPDELVKILDAWANVPAELKPVMIERANLTVYGIAT